MNDSVLLGKIEYNEGKRIKAELEQRGVLIELKSEEPHACGSARGCSISLEVWAQPQDIPQIQEFIRTEHQRAMEGLDFNPALLDAVFDPEKETAQCPACGQEFKTATAKECPECGLVFMTGQEESP